MILSVVCLGIILTIMMTIYNKVAIKYLKIKAGNRGEGFWDSVVWCVGVFTQQAFITSVLSVKRWDIGNVEDLLNSDYEIGYTKNSGDELYLRVIDKYYPTEGDIPSHVARKEITVIKNYKCTDDIAEIPIEYSENYIAFPMSKRSPYRKLINLSIIRMHELGYYKHIYHLMNPTVKKCEKSRTYNSARLADLLAGFGILFIGNVLSIAIFVAECAWKRKKKMLVSIEKNIAYVRHRDLE
ncbi:hypothetical protein NQ318_007917 [Aromia moschata]|uniref:Uncharacterized protein n=1 Tax=Aromia moschata TaxID=1265417 RepID=A0AAV8Y1Z5_9CUCU|nr:hypothetical protein NQ318_007917 [Aromia moschata]